MLYTFHGFWKEFYIYDVLTQSTILKVLPFLTEHTYTTDINKADIIIYSVFNTDIEMLKRKHSKGVVIIEFTGEARIIDTRGEFTDLIIGSNMSDKRNVRFTYLQVYKQILGEVVVPCIPFHKKKDFLMISSNMSGSNMTGYRGVMYSTLKNHFSQIDEYGSAFGKRINGKYWDVSFIRFLSHYKFIVCIENTERDWYHTEKMWNAIIAGCVPIYAGAKTISKVVNPERYIDLNDDASIENIKRLLVDEKEYARMTNQPHNVQTIDLVFDVLMLPKIHYINCDKSVERREYMESQLIGKNYRRFPGILISNDKDIYEKFVLPSHRDLKSFASEYKPGIFGCLLSHLELIRDISETDDDAIIVEDNTNLSNLFRVGWKKIKNKVPKDASLVMLFVQTSNVDAYSVKTYTSGATALIPGKDWTTKGYWISNAYAKKLTMLFYKGIYDLSEYKERWLVADYFLFLFGKCYKFPILTVNDNFSSVIGHTNNFNIFNTLIDGLVNNLFGDG